MKINKLRSDLYFLAKILGDINALQKGKILQRVGNRIIGRFARKATNNIWFK